MLNKLKESYDKLLKSDKFENKGFLCGAFIMCQLEQLKDKNWQIDFYDKEKDEMIAYIMNGDINVEKSQAFTKDYDIKELKIDDVKISLDDALKKGEERLKKHNDGATKIIVILQDIKKLMWNITYMTTNFNILNVKVDAKNGDVIGENFGSMLQFKKD